MINEQVVIYCLAPISMTDCLLLRAKQLQVHTFPGEVPTNSVDPNCGVFFSLLSLKKKCSQTKEQVP